jgi:hypothetical protein
VEADEAALEEIEEADEADEVALATEGAEEEDVVVAEVCRMLIFSLEMH